MESMGLAALRIETRKWKMNNRTSPVHVRHNRVEAILTTILTAINKLTLYLSLAIRATTRLFGTANPPTFIMRLPCCAFSNHDFVRYRLNHTRGSWKLIANPDFFKCRSSNAFKPSWSSRIVGCVSTRLTGQKG